MLKNTTIRTKLIIGFTVMAIIITVVGLVGYNGMNQVMKSQDNVAKIYLPSVQNLLIISQAQTAVWVGERGLINRRMMKPEIRQAQYAWIAASFKRIDEAWAIYDPIPKSEKEAELWKEFQPLWAQWKANHNVVYDLSKEKDKLMESGLSANDEAIEKIDDNVFDASLKSRKSFLEADKILKKIVEFNLNNVHVMDIEADKASDHSTLLLIIFIITGVAFGMVTGVMLTKNIGGIIKSLLKETSKLMKSAVAGQLDIRGDVDIINFEFREIIAGINSTLDAVIGPLNVAAEYIDRVSKGDIPPLITDNYYGDFNEIKTNINMLIDSTNMISDVAQNLSVGNTQVTLTKRSKNDTMIENLIKVINNNQHDASIVLKMSNGEMDFDINIKSDNDIMAKSCLTLRDTLITLVNDAILLVDAAKMGELDVRANDSKHKGDFKRIIKGFNTTLDNVIGPLNVAAEYIDRISKGDIPPKISAEYNGGFNEIKNNLNQCIDTLNALVNAMLENTKIQKAGDIDAFADENIFKGVFKELIKGYNEGMEMHINAILAMIELLKQYSEGNLQNKMPTLPGKQVIATNIINLLRQNVLNLVVDVNLLAKAGIAGELQTRVELTKHQGDFRAIVEGLNNTLDSIINPLNEASHVLEIMSTGDLTIRVEKNYNGDLDNLKTNINQLGYSLSKLIKQVSDAVYSVSTSASEISSNAESLAASSQEQSAQVEEVASAVEEMSRTVTENASSAIKTSDAAKSNGKVAQEGGKVVELTVNKMKDIASVVKTSATNIQKLGESSQQIGEIISVIDDIADQTNLLALNAAIEAARAGEQGRGFAVVADEVRKLAERTTEATKQIAKMIKGIQNETVEAVVAMNKGTAEVQNGIELADRAGQSLEEILKSTQETLHMINQIAAANEEQSATTEEISKNITSISDVTNQNTQRVEEVAHTADDLAKLTEHLNDLMSQFKFDSDSDEIIIGNTISKKGYFQNKTSKKLTGRN